MSYKNSTVKRTLAGIMAGVTLISSLYASNPTVFASETDIAIEIPNNDISDNTALENNTDNNEIAVDVLDDTINNDGSIDTFDIDANIFDTDAILGESDTDTDESTNTTIDDDALLNDIEINLDIDTTITNEQTILLDFDWRKSVEDNARYEWAEMHGISNWEQLIGKQWLGESFEEVYCMYYDDTLEMAELSEYFKGTVFKNFTIDTIELHLRNDISEKDVIVERIVDNIAETQNREATEADYEFAEGLLMVNPSIKLLDDAEVARVATVASDSIYTFSSPTLGARNEHYWSVTLDGYVAFCNNHGLRCSTGYEYKVKSESYTTYAAKAFNFYYSSPKDKTAREVAQFYIWCQGNQQNTLFALCEARLSAYHGYSYADLSALSKTELLSAARLNFPGTYSTIAKYVDTINTAGTSYPGLKLWSCDVAGSQDLWCAAPKRTTSRPADGEDDDDSSTEETDTYYTAEATASATHTISLHKSGTVTRENLAGIQFVVSNGSSSQTITTDSSGYASCSFSYTVSASGGSSGGEADAQAVAQANANAVRDAFSASYTVTELQPTGFYIIDQQSFSMTGNATYNMGDLTDNEWKVPITIDKHDADTGRQIADYTTFIVQEYVAASNTWIDSPIYSVVRLANRTYTVQASYSGALQGYFYYTQASLGKFRIIEKLAPSSGTTYGYYGDWSGKRQWNAYIY